MIETIDNTEMFLSYRRREALRPALVWIAALAVTALLALAGAAILVGALAVVGRPERVEFLSGFPSIDGGIYPDAHVEEVEL